MGKSGCIYMTLQLDRLYGRSAGLQRLLNGRRDLPVMTDALQSYVGNKMTTTVLQVLGADVSAIHTVHFSNHTAYQQFTGRRVPAAEIRDLYDGLVNAGLEDMDCLLSGYTGSAEAVRTVGDIACDLKRRRDKNFFWVMDPVMGDAGRLYVAEDIPSVYRGLMRDADLVLPNAFEAEVLAEERVSDLRSCVSAVEKLHRVYGVRNVVVTSLRLRRRDARLAGDEDDDGEGHVLGAVGSTSTSDGSARPFLLTIPMLPIFFSGTGDMFAALMLVRLREAAGQQGLIGNGQSWAPRDEVKAVVTPLAKAAERVLASMYAVLVKTAKRRDQELRVVSTAPEEKEAVQRMEHLRKTKASEVRVVSYAHELTYPPVEGVEGAHFSAMNVEELLPTSPS